MKGWMHIFQFNFYCFHLIVDNIFIWIHHFALHYKVNDSIAIVVIGQSQVMKTPALACIVSFFSIILDYPPHSPSICPSRGLHHNVLQVLVVVAEIYVSYCLRLSEPFTVIYVYSEHFRPYYKYWCCKVETPIGAYVSILIS